MKKLVIALTALAAFTGSASAADLGARPYTKAPAPVAMAPSWTGLYIFGGGGGGIWAANGGVDNSVTGDCIICTNTRTGGDGWFGTVGAGYDWQFTARHGCSVSSATARSETSGAIIGRCLFFGDVRDREEPRRAWAAGARVGYLVSPNVLSVRQRRLHRDLLDGHHPARLVHRQRHRACTLTASIPRAGSSAAASRTI